MPQQNLSIRKLLDQMVTNLGNSLAELSEKQPVMLVFLRHFGCTFCRAALAELAEKRAAIESTGTQLVFVHMSDNATASRYFTRYHFDKPEHISDPECEYYAQFGLVKGNFRQLFGLTNWMRGFQLGVIEGHGIGKMMGDGFQMPGVFVIQNREIQKYYIHKLSSDQPDYEKLATCCVT